jgi:hypothetical protein
MEAPSKIKHEDKPPNRKYFKPADVAANLFLFNEAKTYKEKDCSSILRYIDKRSKLDIKKVPPKILKMAINEY